MRFYYAIGLFVLAAVSLAVGLGQQTIWRPSPNIVQEIDTAALGGTKAPVTVINTGIASSNDGNVSITASGDSKAFIAVAPQYDVDAWVGNAKANIADEQGGKVVVTVKGDQATVPSPDGSDLWLAQAEGNHKATLNANLLGDSAILIASNGSSAAPSTIKLSWVNPNPAPFAWPLSVFGVLCLAAGLVLFLIDALLKRLGPRRRSHRRGRMGEIVQSYQTVSADIDFADASKTTAGQADLSNVSSTSPTEKKKDDDTGSGSGSDSSGSSGSTGSDTGSSSGSSGSGSGSNPVSGSGAENAGFGSQGAGGSKPAGDDRPKPKRPLLGRIAVAGGLSAILLLGGVTAGCSGQSNNAQPTQTEVAGLDPAKAPPVTEAHFQEILNNVAKTVSASDKDFSLATAQTRLAGQALEVRKGYYQLKQKYQAKQAVAPVISSPIKLFMPQSGRSFPRTVAVAVQDEKVDKAPYRIYLLQQSSARENYKIIDVINSVVGTVPDMPSELVGANMLSGNSSDLLVQPDKLLAQYSDILANGQNSQYAGSYDLAGDKLLQPTQDSVKAQIAQLGQDGQLEVQRPQGASPAVAISTAENDAVVFVTMNEQWLVKPTKANGVIKNLDAEIQAVLGKDTTTKGVERTYGTTLMFVVPKAGSTDKIRLVGYSQVLSSIQELP